MIEFKQNSPALKQQPSYRIFLSVRTQSQADLSESWQQTEEPNAKLAEWFLSSHYLQQWDFPNDKYE